MSEQNENIKRVNSKLAPFVLSFLTKRINDGQLEFYIDELRLFVGAHVQTAPASPQRILQLLRKTGQCDYEVLNRKQSLYRVISASERVAA